MKNKALESILLKNSLKQTIDLIEKCEDGYYTELRITKKEGITSDEKLDKRVISYLKKIHVNVIFITEEEYYKSHNKFYKPEKICLNAVHGIALNGKIDMVEKNGRIDDLMVKGHKVNRFRIEEDSYVTCSDCGHIIKL